MTKIDLESLRLPPTEELARGPVMYEDHLSAFLTERVPTPYKGLRAVWRKHWNAMYTTRCAHPMGCSGLVNPGDDYYHRRADEKTIHTACVEKLFHLRNQGEDRADV